MTDVRDILEQYIRRQEGLDERKVALTMKLLEVEKANMEAFNQMRHELFQLDGWTRNGIPQDKLTVQEGGSDLGPDNGCEI